MHGRINVSAAAAIAVLLLVAFLVGRHAEQRSRSEQRRSAGEALTVQSTPALVATPIPLQELPIERILMLSFPQFYETLRSAPRDAHQTWAAQLEQMRPGPQRTAAMSAFYKLLVQFDPELATATVEQIGDPDIRSFALGIIVEAAPGYGVPFVAELVTRIDAKEDYPRDYFSEIVGEWAAIDPSAAAKFLDRNAAERSRHIFGDVIEKWAALEPSAAQEWLSRLDTGEEIARSTVVAALVSGWFLNDPPASVAYVLDHAQDPEFREAVGDTVERLYVRSAEHAKAYIERLPADARFAAFESLGRVGNYKLRDDLGDPRLAPRVMTEWITEFPPDYWRGTLKEKMAVWAEENLREAIAWIASREATLRSEIAAEFSIRHDAPVAAAAQSVFQIPDADLRERLLSAMLVNSTTTAESVRSEVEASSLTAAQKQHLLELTDEADAAKIAAAAADEE